MLPDGDSGTAGGQFGRHVGRTNGAIMIDLTAVGVGRDDGRCRLFGHVSRISQRTGLVNVVGRLWIRDKEAIPDMNAGLL